MKIKLFEEGSIGTNCFIVYDEASKKAFCVDVSDRISNKYFEFIDSKNLQIEYLLLTHGHYDHCADILRFTARYPLAKVVISEADYQNILSSRGVFCERERFAAPAVLVNDGDTIPFCGQTIQVIATPGHTSGSVCYLYLNHLFCGDTVFDGSIGRTDLPTGSFFEIMKSVAKISALGDYQLYPGHMGVTDIATQRRVNSFFR